MMVCKKNGVMAMSVGVFGCIGNNSHLPILSNRSKSMPVAGRLVHHSGNRSLGRGTATWAIAAESPKSARRLSLPSEAISSIKYNGHATRYCPWGVAVA